MNARNSRQTRQLAALVRGAYLIGIACAISGLPAHASGGSGAVATSAFDSFLATMLAWASGSLGIGLALTALVIGGAISIVRGSGAGAGIGIGLAAIFAFGPNIIAAAVRAGSTAIIGA